VIVPALREHLAVFAEDDPGALVLSGCEGRPAAAGPERSRAQDLMARTGHDSERAAMIYQHEAQGADKAITTAIDTHVQSEQAKRDDEDGPAGILIPAG
jgi:hypothetical protein